MILQVGVKAVLRNEEGKILLLKRSAKYESAEGSWDIPGGRIDAGSMLVENLAREIKEETGLDLIGEPVLVGAQDIFFQKEDGEDFHIVRLTYAASAEGEPVLDGAEHTAYRWTEFSELASLTNLDRYFSKLVSARVITEDSLVSLLDDSGPGAADIENRR